MTNKKFENQVKNWTYNIVRSHNNNPEDMRIWIESLYHIISMHPYSVTSKKLKELYYRNPSSYIGENIPNAIDKLKEFITTNGIPNFQSVVYDKEKDSFKSMLPMDLNQEIIDEHKIFLDDKEGSSMKNAKTLEELLVFLEKGGIDTSKLNIIIEDEDEDVYEDLSKDVDKWDDSINKEERAYNNGVSDAESWFSDKQRNHLKKKLPMKKNSNLNKD